uniref:Uncharacterized protein n=1 Tax=Setaria viridis TaxID=4556 RepID=A0A4U6SZL8_SETVI|nr:hypothetical protein SEVIR_9G239550v2 [Setaria viridis]
MGARGGDGSSKGALTFGTKSSSYQLCPRPNLLLKDDIISGLPLLKDDVQVEWSAGAAMGDRGRRRSEERGS